MRYTNLTLSEQPCAMPDLHSRTSGGPRRGRLVCPGPDSGGAGMLTQFYASPLGEILLGAGEDGLVGLWFAGQSHFPALSHAVPGDSPALNAAKNWLDQYFSGEIPAFLPPISLKGTDFQLRVWKALLNIPYGQVVTYGELAKKLGVLSAQAVGGAVGRNPISLILPCHRVVGSKGQLTGYAGGLDRKKWLLDRERYTIQNYKL